MAITVTSGNYVMGTASTLTLGGTALGSTSEDGIVVEASNNNMMRKCDQARE